MADEMLDIVHYALEEDFLRGVGMAESPTEAVQRFRESLYSTLYHRPYQRPAGRLHHEHVSAPAHSTSPAVQISGARRTVKPYIPPTPVDPSSSRPFGSALDAPLGG